MNNQAKRVGVYAFIGFWPDEMLGAVETLLTRLAWLVPPWCREVTVLYEPTALENSPANCSIDFLHRLATLRFGPNFICSDALERQTLVVHELLHISTMVLVCNVEGAIRQQFEEGHFRSKLLSEIEEREEWVIADLSRAIAEQFAETSDTEP